MGFSATWTTTCDGCGLVYQVTHTPDTIGNKGYSVWGPGFPQGWIRLLPTTTDPTQPVFHTEACYTAWLRRLGRYAELEEFEHSQWRAS